MIGKRQREGREERGRKIEIEKERGREREEDRDRKGEGKRGRGRGSRREHGEREWREGGSGRERRDFTRENKSTTIFTHVHRNHLAGFVRSTSMTFRPLLDCCFTYMTITI